MHRFGPFIDLAVDVTKPAVISEQRGARVRVEAVKRLQKQLEGRVRHVCWPARASRTRAPRASRMLFTPRT